MLVIRSEKIRRMLRIALPFAVMPALVLLLPLGIQSQYYALVSFIMVLLALLLFLAGFERRDLGTRRMILVSVMTALSVLGRLLPLIKPITALTVLSAMYLGPEAGFLVGALSAVLSNFVMGQGPWTPFQMLAWGLIGLFAGILAKPLQRSPLLLYIYGMLSGVAYSMLLDIWTTVWTYKEFTLAEYAAAVIAGRPQFHISLVMDVSPYCDCHAENDIPVVPDIGMFASFDPVALDQACADAVLNAPICAGSVLEERHKDGCDHFSALFPESDWSVQLEHAVQIGLGSREYELVEI